jgi:triose/dihydroxyacetone kinase / FAD-AMP lyase (cyclizing)
VDPVAARKALSIALNRLIAAEPEITKYDTIVGDGDCGIGLKRGAEGELGYIWYDVETMLKSLKQS